MTSIYERALGEDFGRLHPQVQRRFGFSSSEGVASVGRGVMEEVWHGPFWTLPFLYVGAWRRIMFPEQGKNVPFTIQNYAFRDPLGRETVSLIRTFETRRTRRFDAYMVYSEKRGRIIDYMGTHEHLAVDIEAWVDDEGALCLKSGSQRFYEGLIGFSWPMLFSGVAEVRESFDESIGRFRISVDVRNKLWGRLFGYRGTFDAEWIDCPPGGTPPSILPRRYEKRD